MKKALFIAVQLFLCIFVLFTLLEFFPYYAPPSVMLIKALNPLDRTEVLRTLIGAPGIWSKTCSVRELNLVKANFKDFHLRPDDGKIDENDGGLTLDSNHDCILLSNRYIVIRFIESSKQESTISKGEIINNNHGLIKMFIIEEGNGRGFGIYEVFSSRFI